jgi:1,4-alpha-glucan branching enzyme
VGRESFEVQFHAWSNDLTAARVLFEDASSGAASATVLRARGPYAVWAAQLPPASTDQLRYVVELSDGADVDYFGPAGMSEDLPALDDWFLVDFLTLSHAPIGATPVAAGTVFKVWAPTSSIAHVRGEFNGWGLSSMSKVGEHFIVQVPAAGVGQRYKYFFDGYRWNTDPRGRAIDAGDNYNAIIEDPLGFTWTRPDFAVPDFGRLVIYQLHVGTFAGRSDPAGFAPFPSRYVDIAERVSYLAELGVNCVMLMPVTEFPGDLSAGYNPITAWSPERKYGDPDDLKLLVDTLHGAGIAVILDIVWNHFSSTDNFLWEYNGTQIYFDSPSVETPWGSQADFNEPAVRDYFADSVHHWLGEMGLDGFRVDATSFMNLPEQSGAGWTLMQRLNDEVNWRHANKIVVAEQLPDDPAITRGTAQGGAGFDAQYFDAFADRLREELIDAALGDPEMWKIRDIIQGYGDELSGGRVMNYLELHDEVWPASGGQRFVKTVDPSAPHDDEWAKGRIKLGQGLVMTAPGIPALHQGSEWLESIDFGTDFSSRIDWAKKDVYPGFFRYFQDLIALRTQHRSLHADAFVQVYHVDESGNVIAFRRGTGESQLVVIANFANEARTDYRIGVPLTGNWEQLLNSQALSYEGGGTIGRSTYSSAPIGWDGFSQSIVVHLPKMAFAVLGFVSPATTVSGPWVVSSVVRLEAASPNPVIGRGRIAFTLGRTQAIRLTLHDVRGRRLSVLLDGPRDPGRHVVDLDLRELPQGVYFVRLQTPTETLSRKLIRLVR